MANLTILLVVCALAITANVNEAAPLLEDVPFISEQSSSREYNANLMLDLIQLNGITYFFSDKQKMTWMDAMNYCLAFGMNLASANNFLEHTLLISYIDALGMTGSYFYLSGNNIGRNAWLWLDGTLLSVDAWQPGEPNENQRHCMILYNEHWWDMNCDAANYFVCELPQSLETTTSVETTTSNGGNGGE